MNIGRSILGVAAAAGVARWALRAQRRAAYPLEGKVVYITGGSRGLGLELARAYARHGAHLVLVARDGRELALAEAELAKSGCDVLTLQADVSDAGAAKDAVDAARARFGDLDVVVNCAGQIRVGPFEAMTIDDIHQGLRGNFWGAANTIDAVLPAMRARRRGRIVNISSVAGLVGVPHLSPYVAGKFALTGYSLTLRAELARHGITVVTVCPGLMRTGSPRHAMFKGDAAVEYAAFRVADALPILSMNAARAAERIVRATQEGDARLILTAQAKLAAMLEAVSPDAVAAVSQWATQLLPPVDGVTSAVEGADLPDLAPSGLTTLDDEAADRNNENVGLT